MTDNPFQDSDDIDLSTEEMDPQSDPGTLDDIPDLQQSQAEELDSLEYEAPPVTDFPPAQFEESGPSDLDSLSTPEPSEPEDLEDTADLEAGVAEDMGDTVDLEPGTVEDLGDTVDLAPSEPDDLMDIGDPEELGTSDDLPAVSFQDDFDYSGGMDTPDFTTQTVNPLPNINFNESPNRPIPGTGYKTAGTYWGS